MHADTDYRSYWIYFDGARWVAETKPDEDEGAFLQLTGRSEAIVRKAVDALHACSYALPPWLTDWSRGLTDAVNVDPIFAEAPVLRLLPKPPVRAARAHRDLKPANLCAASETFPTFTIHRTGP